MKVLHFQVKGMEAKHMAWLMASNPLSIGVQI
jgi:hypothetical protein